MDFDDLAVLRADERRRLVAVAESVTLLPGHLLHVHLAVDRLRVHGDEGLHAVAAVDVQHLCDRSEAVCGIDVAAELPVVVQPPAQPVLRILLPVGIPERRQVVAVSPLHVKHFAEDTLLRHVQRVQFEEVVTAVLQHHAVQAGLLGQVDQLPDFRQVHRRRHLDGHVLAVRHRLPGDEEVVFPVGGDVDEVDVLAPAEFFISVLTGVDVGGRHACLAENVLAFLGSAAFVVAEGHHLDAGDVHPAFHRTGPAHAQSDEGHPHDFHLRGGEVQGTLLSCRACRYFCDGLSAGDFVGPVELCRCR